MFNFRKMVQKIIYNYHPRYKISVEGILQRYEGEKWVPEKEFKDHLVEQIGKHDYESFRKDIKRGLSDDKNKILGMREQKRWARVANPIKFTLLGIFMSIAGLILTSGSLFSLIAIAVGILDIVLKVREKSKSPLQNLSKKKRDLYNWEKI